MKSSGSTYNEQTHLIDPQRLTNIQDNERRESPRNILTESMSTDDVESTSSANVVILDRSSIDHTTTNLETFMHLIRGNVGTGLLAMPVAFLSAGLWTGAAGVLIIGACCIYCMHLLVSSCHIVCRRTGYLTLDYGAVMEKAIETGPLKLRRLSLFGRRFVNMFLMITQLGFCCIYIVFVAESIKYVIHHFYSNDPDLRIYMAGVILILIPYVLIKHLTILSVFSAIANLLIVVSLGIIIQFVVRGLPDVSERPAFNSTQYLPLFIGTVFYTFEGIGCLLPIENKMLNPEDLGGWTGVMNLAMVIATCMYVAMGFYGYLKFGNSVQGSIALSLPTNNWLYLSVNIMVALVIFITFGLQFYVPISFLWPWFKRKFHIERHATLAEAFFRIGILLFAACLALVVPHLDLLISLVGALASSGLAIIFPTTIDMLVRYSDKRLTIPIILVDVTICLLGIIGCVSGTIVSMKGIINTFK